MYTDIGALIAERRREKEMNQAELAAALDELGFGVTNQAVSNGRRAPRCRTRGSFSRYATCWG